MVCPKCGLVVAFSEADDGTRPTCNPLRSPDCWRVEARLTKQGAKPLRRDGRADLSALPDSAPAGVCEEER